MMTMRNVDDVGCSVGVIVIVDDVGCSVGVIVIVDGMVALPVPLKQ